MIRLALTLALLAAGAPRPDSWTILGPGGGAQFCPAISPHDPSVVLVACDMTGSYLSRDGGESWRMFNLRGVSRSFAFDPADAKTMYAGTSVLWRSTDAGSTWRMVWPDPKRITGSDMMDDHAGERLMVDGAPAPRLRAFAIHPKDGRRMYVVAQNGRDTELLASADGGATWKSEGALSFPAGKLWIHAGGAIYAAGDDAIYRRDPGQWTEDARLVVYAVSQKGGQISDDGGTMWRPLALPGPTRVCVQLRPV